MGKYESGYIDGKVVWRIKFGINIKLGGVIIFLFFELKLRL